MLAAAVFYSLFENPLVQRIVSALKGKVPAWDNYNSDSLLSKRS